MASLRAPLLLLSAWSLRYIHRNNQTFKAAVVSNRACCCVKGCLEQHIAHRDKFCHRQLCRESSRVENASQHTAHRMCKKGCLEPLLQCRAAPLFATPTTIRPTRDIETTPASQIMCYKETFHAKVETLKQKI